MYLSVSLLFLMFGFSYGWIINNVDFVELKRKGSIRITEDNEVEFLDHGIDPRFINWIYPGTKWCGAGDAADGYDDLGRSKETDMCCREHDLCPDLIPTGETKHNLTNKGLYTSLSCECDEKFRQCLHDAKCENAKNVGTVYFSVLWAKCFREDYPVVGCNKRGGLLNLKCLEPKYNTSGDQRYQWFDLPNY